MEGLNLPKRSRQAVWNFSRQLQDIYPDDLIAIILYGSAASGEFVDRHSNLNILVVLQNTDLGHLKKAESAIKNFRTINPLFLSEEYINKSTDVFPIEFLDIQENYTVLFGKDIFKDINIDLGNLRFQCEQELKVKLLSLKHLYLRLHKDRVALRSLLVKSLTSILHILRNVLRLKGRAPAYLKEEILKQVAREFPIDKEVWERILTVKRKQMKLSRKDTQELFISFIRDLERLVDLVDKL